MVKEWTYGKEGNAYPVRPGQTWTCGSHTYVCADWMAEPVIIPVTVGLVYCDPPWNDSNIGSFYTKARRTRPDVPFTDYIWRLIKLIGPREGFLETGKQNLELVVNSLTGQRLNVYDVWPITYYRTKPCYLLHFGPLPMPPGPVPDLTGVDDENTPFLAIQARCPKGGIVLDLCAGRGLTSRAAQQAGRASYNVEMHPNRMSAALFRMQALIHQEPKLLKDYHD